MRKLGILFGGSIAVLVALVGVMYATGWCPCELRRQLQYKLAMLLLEELIWEAEKFGVEEEQGGV